MGKNPRGWGKGLGDSHVTDAGLLHVGYVTTNLVAGIYAPILTKNAVAKSEAFANYLVNKEAESEVKTVFKNEDVINELNEFLRGLSKELSSGPEWKARVNASKFERRLNEKYGILRPLLTDPRFEPYVRFLQRKHALGHFRVTRRGDGPLPLSSSMILLFMLHRNKVRVDALVLAFLFLVVGLQPWALVLSVAIFVKWLERRKNERPKGMSKKGVVVEPYYDKSDHHKSLLEPVGVPLENVKISDEEKYDCILLSNSSSGPDVLYCAALLARVGKRVLVLSTEDDASGCRTLNSSSHKKWKAGIPFDVNDSKVGRITQQQNLLAPALCSRVDCQGGIRFAQIGGEADGYAYDIITVPGMGKGSDDKDDIPFVLRAGGVKALAEDACIFLGDGWAEEDSAITSFLSQCASLNVDSSKYFLAKLLPDWANNIEKGSNGTYGESACRYAGVFLKMLLPQSPHVRSLAAAIGLRSENLSPNKSSMGVHISNCATACSPEGYFYPIGGPRSLCLALQATIEAHGGKVYTGAKLKELIFTESTEDDKGDNGGQCVGVKLSSGKVFNTSGDGSVVSGHGFIPTFLQLIPESVRDKYGVPSGLPALTERRPLMHFLIGIDGDAEDLELPAADWWRLPGAALPNDKIDNLTGEVKVGDFGNGNEDEDVDNSPVDGSGTEVKKVSNARKVKFEEGKSWMRVSFPSAKDPSWKERYSGVTTCVVTIEADDDFVQLLDSKPKVYVPLKFGEGEVSRLQDKVMSDVMRLYPQLEGKIVCRELRGPIRGGLSQNPERFAAKGIRPKTNYPGLFICGSDLTIDGFSGGVVGSWLAANAVIGYNPVDHLLLQKNITYDLRQWLPEPEVDVGDVAVPFKKYITPLLGAESYITTTEDTSDSAELSNNGKSHKKVD